MSQVTEINCMQNILERVPAFKQDWQTHLDYWNGEEAGLCNDMSEFSRYVADLILTNQLESLPQIFSLVEEFLNEGNQQVQEAIATCFLENLINCCSSDDLDAEAFIHLLGPASEAYCKAWDEFTGVKTKGLW